MNIHCPNCQKELMIPDEHAGQHMKCPLCHETFMAPSLPGSAPEPASAPSAPEPTIQEESFRMQPPADAPAPEELETDKPSQPASSQPSAPTSAPTAPQPEVKRPTQCSKSVSFPLDPNIIQWIAVAAIVAIFVLFNFPWVSIRMTASDGITQSGWQTAFGGYSEPAKAEDPYKASSDTKDPEGSVAMIVYELFFIILLIVTLLAGALSIMANPVPALQVVVNWRWSIVAGLCFFLFFLLCLQLVSGFSLESSYQTLLKDSQMPDDWQYGKLATLSRDWPLTLVFWLHLLATLCTIFIAWLDIRKSQPIPKFEIHY